MTSPTLYQRKRFGFSVPSVSNPFEAIAPAVKKEDAVEDQQAYRVRRASVRLKEKYVGYEETLEFIDYLAATEMLFSQAKKKDLTKRDIQDHMIRFDIKHFAEDSKIDEKLFISIYEEFQATQLSMRVIAQVALSLRQQYADLPDCLFFIDYLEEAYSFFGEADTKGFSLDTVQQHLVRVKMQLLCSDGYPSIHTLETVYQEFQDLLAKGE